MTHIALACLCAAAAFAAPDAGIEWLGKTHHFGAFHESDGAVSCTFRFVNHSGHAVAVGGVRTSCGCTTPEYSRTPVASGDTGAIEVSYHPEGRPGRFAKQITVTFSGDGDSHKLGIDGTVVGTAESVAGRYPVAAGDNMRLSRPVLMFGQMKKGAVRTVTLQAYNASTGTLRPRVAEAPPYVDITIAPDSVAPAEQFSVIGYFKSGRCPYYGFVSDTISLDGVPIEITATVEEDFSRLSAKELSHAPQALLSDTSVDFGIIPGQGQLHATLTLKNTGRSRLEIRRICSADSGITATAGTYTLKPGKSTAINIAVDCGALPGALLNGRLTIITNDPAHPVQTVRAVGMKRTDIQH